MGVYSSFSDSELVVRLNQQDKHAVEEAYNRYWILLFTHAKRMLKDTSEAKDIVQDIFTSLLVNTGNLKIKTQLDSYLYRAVKNKVIDAFDKDQNRKKYISTLKEFVEKGEYITDEAILENEMKLRIEKALSSLPPKMREVFELSREGNLSRKEIAVVTDVSEETVKTQLKRAMRILRSKLTTLFI